ncbi:MULTISPECIES: hypothetical protein [unclassified Bradyrhizobium]|uniref:hypothetical protein n=1 Tax=unclassified Bradyrhizobium TaxID=2631580 RepID=UPI0024786898|nr:MULTISPECIES: hypothetical protein [unclassified Bradyrhizobium]WGR72975.1 hypothetical protein MTX24_08905 [Bradyrhizobium sp. ISRA426]WGR77810.1 hypothetical protein MTX21_33860 [Bradyrhizobium sp. ISRA430]WGR88215.1 hypothetical protein MTX25_08910 [Bradyrhizobium sp. ISRA432]
MDLQAFEALTLESLQIQNHRRPEKTTPIQRFGRFFTGDCPAEPGGRQAASYGNAEWISPAAIMPVSVPGPWRRIPMFLMDGSGAFAIPGCRYHIFCLGSSDLSGQGGIGKKIE